MSELISKRKSALLASIAFVAAAAVATPALAETLDDDPAYQAYLRWNGFHAESAPDQSGVMRGAQGRAAVDAGKTAADSSYQAYLRWNGFAVSSPADESNVIGGAEGSATVGTMASYTAEDLSFRKYLRWNGFSE
jgi:hypothetical protein